MTLDASILRKWNKYNIFVVIILFPFSESKMDYSLIVLIVVILWICLLGIKKVVCTICPEHVNKIMDSIKNKFSNDARDRRGPFTAVTNDDPDIGVGTPIQSGDGETTMNRTGASPVEDEGHKKHAEPEK